LINADSKSLARSIRQRGQIEPIYVSEIEQLSELLATQLEDGDMVLTQGAGNIGVISQSLATDPLLTKEQT
jgi:UDP-N-acetylmuramate--alanine ligase